MSRRSKTLSLLFFFSLSHTVILAQAQTSGSLDSDYIVRSIGLNSNSRRDDNKRLDTSDSGSSETVVSPNAGQADDIVSVDDSIRRRLEQRFLKLLDLKRLPSQGLNSGNPVGVGVGTVPIYLQKLVGLSAEVSSRGSKAGEREGESFVVGLTPYKVITRNETRRYRFHLHSMYSSGKLIDKTELSVRSGPTKHRLSVLLLLNISGTTTQASVYHIQVEKLERISWGEANLSFDRYQLSGSAIGQDGEIVEWTRERGRETEFVVEQDLSQDDLNSRNEGTSKSPDHSDTASHKSSNHQRGTASNDDDVDILNDDNEEDSSNGGGSVDSELDIEDMVLVAYNKAASTKLFPALEALKRGSEDRVRSGRTRRAAKSSQQSNLRQKDQGGKRVTKPCSRLNSMKQKKNLEEFLIKPEIFRAGRMGDSLHSSRRTLRLTRGRARRDARFPRPHPPSDDQLIEVSGRPLVRLPSTRRPQEDTPLPLPRPRRSASCGLNRWYLDFSRLGWDQWIQYPKGYYANYCAGPCPTPSEGAENLIMTNHAFVKGLYILTNERPADVDQSNRTVRDERRMVGVTEGIVLPRACCVPIRLSALNLLYMNDTGQYIMREMKEMIADGCGCL